MKNTSEALDHSWDQIRPASSREVEIDRLYSEILIPCWPDLLSGKVLQLMLSNRESAEQYGAILRFDLSLQAEILKHVNAMKLSKTIEDPAHAVSILGIEVVRDIIIGRGIYTKFYQDDGSQKLVPDITEFTRYVEFARKSQQVAHALKDTYPELAYAGGVLFDLLKGKMDSMAVPHHRGMEKPVEFLEQVWKRSIRSGIAAVILSETVSLAHKRFSFIAGLVHNIGKLVLYAYDPSGYGEALKFIRESKKDSGDEELRRFGIDHSQAGSLFLGPLKFLGDIERVVDFHHGIGICKFQSIPVYHFAGLIFVAAHMVRLVKDKESIIRDPANAFFQEEAFLCLGLNLSQFIKIQKKYLKLRDFEDLL